MKIYTKTGDKGETGLLGGARVPKHDHLIEVIGDIDELNAALGVLYAEQTIKHPPILTKIQHTLFVIGSRLASLRTNSLPQADVSEKAILELENWIDEMDAMLPRLTQFILPGGHQAAAQAFLVRAICRRAERHMSPLLFEKPGHLDSCFTYLNRLSDALFTYARYINAESKTTETPWVK